jgi:hypothetical protein
LVRSDAVVWLSIALVVVGTAFILRGALLSGAQPIRLPIRSLPLPKPRTALIVGGVAVVAVLGTAAVNVETHPRNGRAGPLVRSSDEGARRPTVLALTAPAVPSSGGNAAAPAPADDASPDALAAAPPAQPLSRVQIFTNADDDPADGQRRPRMREAEPTATPEPEDDGESDESDDDKKSGGKGDRHGGNDD